LGEASSSAKAELAHPARSDREGDLSNQAGEDERAAQAMGVGFGRQEQAAEADQCGKRHGDLASDIHVMFPRAFRLRLLTKTNRIPGLPEAFVVGGLTVGEKQEQSKN
jgi:hypothetical protein